LLFSNGHVNVYSVQFLVLDEADRMLDKGFENDIRRIIEQTTQGTSRQTLMFSATWPDSVRRLAASFQRNPVRITVGQDDLTANRRVEQGPSFLFSLLRTLPYHVPSVIDVFDDSRQKE